MHCPFCRHPDSRVVDSRTTDDGTSIRRRRQCPDCSRRFTTVETASLMVIKRSGVTEPFSRTKVISGVRKACQGRPVTEDALAKLGQRVEEALRATGSAELTTHDVGLAIPAPCRNSTSSRTCVSRPCTGLSTHSKTSRPPSRNSASSGLPQRNAGPARPSRSPCPPPPPTEQYRLTGPGPRKWPVGRQLSGRRPVAGAVCGARGIRHTMCHGKIWALQGVFAHVWEAA